METYWDEAPLTLGELCVAIIEGRVSFTRRRGALEVDGGELRRLRRRAARQAPDRPTDGPREDYVLRLDTGRLS